MKKLLSFLVAGAMLGLTVGAYAQGAGPQRPGRPQMGQGGMRGGMMNRMAKLNETIYAKLNLTAAQKTKVKALDAKSAKARQALMEKARNGGNREEIMPKFREMNQNHRKELLKILTPAQGKKYQDLWKAETDKFRRNRPGGPGGPGGPGRPGPRGAGA